MYDILELNKKLLTDLREIAKGLKIKRVESYKKQNLIYQILDQQAILAAESKTKSKEVRPSKEARPIKEARPVKAVQNKPSASEKPIRRRRKPKESDAPLFSTKNTEPEEVAKPDPVAVPDQPKVETPVVDKSSFKPILKKDQKPEKKRRAVPR